MVGASGDRWVAALDTLSADDRRLISFDRSERLDVLTDLQALAEEAKTKSIEHRWRFRRPGHGGETVVLRDLFGKIVTWIDRFKQVGDIVVQYDPAHTALPWAGVRFLLQIVVSDVQKFDFVSEGAETIARSISRLTILENIYLSPQAFVSDSSKALGEGLVRLYASIFVYLARAKQYYEQSTTKRFLKASVKPQEEFEKLLREIDSEQTSVDRFIGFVNAENTKNIIAHIQTLSVDQQDKHAHLQELLKRTEGPICRMSSQLDHLEDHLDHSERIEILRWLSSQPYFEHHQQIQKQALRGSGQWLLQDPVYKQWRSDSTSSCVWLHGVPGSGKSTLVSIVIEDIMKSFGVGQNPQPVYFYCSRSAAERDRSNPDAVLASILRQLSCVEPTKALLAPVVEAYKKKGEGFASRGLPLEESRDLIMTLTEAYSITTIIVDALDECDSDRRQSLLDAFEEILEDSAGLVKIFISSRDDQDIVELFRKYPNLNITSSKNTGDIEMFVSTETEKLVRKGRLLRHSQARVKMQKLIIDRVSRGADGMFRWASLQLDVLCSLKVDKDVRKNLGRLPPKLEELYVEVYDNLTSQGEDAGRNIIKNTLKWLLSAQETFNASEFLWAVAVNLSEPIQKEQVLDLCHNFVIYDEGLDTFRFAHLSVREFLEKRPEFSTVSCNILAAETCLLQLIASVDSSGAASHLSDGHIFDSHEVGMAKESPKTEFVWYSNHFWMVHCRYASQNARREDTDFGRQFRSWLSEDSMHNSALDMWVQWYCSKVFEDDGSFQLQKLLVDHTNSLLRGFFIAVAFGFSEVAEVHLHKKRIDEETLMKAIPLAVVTEQHEALELLMSDRNEVQIAPSFMLRVINWVDIGILEKLLGKGQRFRLTNQMIIDMIKSGRLDEQYYVRLVWLLDHDPDFTVNEKILVYATRWASLDVFRLLLTRTADTVISEDMVRGAVWGDLAKLKLLLGRVGSSRLTSDLIDVAVDSRYNTAMVEFLLEHIKPTIITEDLMIKAAKKRDRELLNLMLLHGGQITQNVLLESARRVSKECLDVLLQHGCKIDGNVLEAAAENDDFHAGIGLSMLLKRADDSVVARKIPGLLYAVARRAHFGKGRADVMKQLLDLTDQTIIAREMHDLLRERLGWELTRELLNRVDDGIFAKEMTGLLHAVVQGGDDGLDFMNQLLKRVDETTLSEEMESLLLRVLEQRFGATEMLRSLLERATSAAITEDVFMSACLNEYVGNEMMQMLLERGEATEITEEVVEQAMKNLDLDVALSVLASAGTSNISGGVLEAAAANPRCGDQLMRTLLKGTEHAELPKRIFSEALANRRKANEVMVALEEVIGPIQMTEDMLSLLHYRNERWALERVEPALITREWLIAAMGVGSADWRRAIAEKSAHIPIELDVLEVAIRSSTYPVSYSNYQCFRFLWNRAHLDEVPQSLIRRAAEHDPQIFEFLLDEGIYIEFEEGLSMAAARQRGNPTGIFRLLLDRGIALEITSNAVKAALAQERPKPTDFQWLLDHSTNLEITDEMFHLAASNRYAEVLHALSKYRGMDSVPSKWLDVVELRDAARNGNIETLEKLLDRGVEPDFADNYGQSPLYLAARNGHERSVQMLLAAGAAPDPVAFQRTPLCWCAFKGHSGIAKLLVEAGASLDFRDKNGRTPVKIARWEGRSKVYRYLKQCEEDRKETKHEAL